MRHDYLKNKWSASPSPTFLPAKSASWLVFRSPGNVRSVAEDAPKLLRTAIRDQNDPGLIQVGSGTNDVAVGTPSSARGHLESDRPFRGLHLQLISFDQCLHAPRVDIVLRFWRRCGLEHDLAREAVILAFKYQVRLDEGEGGRPDRWSGSRWAGLILRPWPPTSRFSGMRTGRVVFGGVGNTVTAEGKKVKKESGPTSPRV